MRVVLIGSGNVATHLGKALFHSEYNVVQVYSRNKANAELLANELECEATDNLQLLEEADIYLLSVKDDALPAVLKEMGPKAGLLIHTSGTLPLELIRPFALHTAVVYPLQTFSKHKALDFLQIPIFTEASGPESAQMVNALANAISDTVLELSSEQRKHLHVAAVFACNFTNELYAIAADILKSHQLDFDLLRPLIQETAAKVQSQLPEAVQTGPARRGDTATLAEHQKSLQTNPEWQELYTVLTDGIRKRYAQQ